MISLWHFSTSETSLCFWYSFWSHVEYHNLQLSIIPLRNLLLAIFLLIILKIPTFIVCDRNTQYICLVEWPITVLTHRGSTVGFLLLQCSSGVVLHPRDLQVSVATCCFCRVLIFVSSQYLSVIYLFPVMIHWWVRKPSRGPNNCMLWAMTEARAKLGSRKTGLCPPVISYWPFQCSASVVYLFVIIFIMFACCMTLWPL